MHVVLKNKLAAASASHQQKLLALMMSMFFAFGFCTVLVDTLIPKLKAVFALNYAEVMLTQFCFFGAYFVMSTPAGWLMTRIGYLRGVTVGLVVMAAGAVMFTPAARMGLYPGFLAALFILASGVTIVQVAANPLTASIGAPQQAPSRLTLAQAFNSLATMLGPIVGSALILSHLSVLPDAAHTPPALLASLRQHEANVFQVPFLVIAAILLTLAGLCWRARHWASAGSPGARGAYGRVLVNRRLLFGAIAIFAYVGAEVSIGSSLTNYLMQPDVLGAPAQTAGRLVSVYWGLAMLGRFAGTVILRRAKPCLVLTACALCASLLCVCTGVNTGTLAAASVLIIGLFNSIMFPTIFTLSIETLGDDAAEASGVLCLAIVGGAIVPLLTGLAADRFGLGPALLVPAICYVWVAFFGFSCLGRRNFNTALADDSPGFSA
jgi:FHS family L-fucose permease-like MFS transporter